MTKKQCSFDGCERAGEARTWCMVHYNQWYRTGEQWPIQGLGFRRNQVAAEDRPGCKVDDCPNLTVAKGYCPKHYQSERVNQGLVNHRRKYNKAMVGNKAAHRRVVALLGKASNYPCSQPGCPKDALDWALNHEYATDIITPVGLNGFGRSYSLITESYFPLCRRHHMEFDGTLGMNGRGQT